MKEEWRPHPLYTEYWVSNHGQVLHINLLTPTRFGDHYFQVQMGRMKRKNVHSLVLEAFVGPRQKGKVARHLDGSRTNNRLDNLRYGTYIENMQDRKKHGTGNNGSRHGMSKLTEKDVQEIRDRYKPWKLTLRTLGKEYGVTQDTIKTIISGKRWTHVPQSSSNPWKSSRQKEAA